MTAMGELAAPFFAQGHYASRRGEIPVLTLHWSVVGLVLGSLTIEQIIRAWPWPLDCCAVNDKQIRITGATNGIGLAAAEGAAALGANSRHRRPQQEQDGGCLGPHQGGGRERSDGGHIVSHLSSQASGAADWPPRCWPGYPRLGVLVNNAGAMYGGRQLTTGG